MRCAAALLRDAEGRDRTREGRGTGRRIGRGLRRSYPEGPVEANGPTGRHTSVERLGWPSCYVEKRSDEAASLLGTNVGSCLTPHGTLATLLVLGAAARREPTCPRWR